MKLLRQELATIVGFLTLIGFWLFGSAVLPQTAPLGVAVTAFVVLVAIMLWCVFGVVRHAQCLAALLGEPYGTLILTLAVTGIEVALIGSVMITGAESPKLARDTMFSVVMIVLNGLIGLSLLLGGIRYRTQVYNLQGASSFLSVLLPLSIIGLVLPRFTSTAPGGELSNIEAGFLVVMSVMLYALFVAIQTTTHSDSFRQPPMPDLDGAAAAEERDEVHEHGPVVTVGHHSIGLILAVLPVVLLAKDLAIYIDYGLATSGAPLALGGFLVATIILMPEGISAIQAARQNLLQRAVNICLGSALATIGLTIPAVLIISWVTGEHLVLGLEPVEIVMLAATLIVSMVTFVSPRTNILQGAVHLALFAAYVMLIFDHAI
ncbi:MAG: calcium:proton antiporter [Alphaproteobacteria bacterium]|nr:calcium:proton antiporter [Alphaproteobacteria bacterium]